MNSAKRYFARIALALFVGLIFIPSYIQAADTGLSNLMFDVMPGVSPKILPADKKVAIDFSLTLDIGKFGTFCGDPNTASFNWSVMEDVSGAQKLGADRNVSGTQTESFPRTQGVITKTVSTVVTALDTLVVEGTTGQTAPIDPIPFYLLIECTNRGFWQTHANAAQSAPVKVTVGSGNLIYTCVVPTGSGYAYSCSPKNLSNCSDNPQCGGKTCSQIKVSLCGSAAPDPNGPGGGTDNPTYHAGATATKSYSFEISNPLNGGPNNVLDIINIVSNAILYLAIPLAVLFILWAGFLMLTAGPKPARYEEGKKILKNVILGLAIIFIGKGFITLIYSILELGGGSQATTQSQSLDPKVCTNTHCGNTTNICRGDYDCDGKPKDVGGSCSQNANCMEGLKCSKTNICVYQNGNDVGGPCQDGSDCSADLICNGANQTVEGRELSTCVQPLCVSGFCTNKPGVACTAGASECH